MGSTDIPHASHVLSDTSLFVHVKRDDLMALLNEDNAVPWGTAAPSVSVQSCLCFQEIFKVWVLYIRTATKRASCSSLDALISVAY